MSRVITFSTKFPAYHPRAGEPTRFPELIWNNISNWFVPSYDELIRLNPGKESETIDFWEHSFLTHFFTSEIGGKKHTIRAGHRWIVGDKFSPRVWSGKPYRSKQIIIAPDISVKKVWSFKVIKGCIYFGGYAPAMSWGKLWKNDGFDSEEDFLGWFQYPKKIFGGQIICWDGSVEY